MTIRGRFVAAVLAITALTGGCTAEQWEAYLGRAEATHQLNRIRHATDTFDIDYDDIVAHLVIAGEPAIDTLIEALEDPNVVVRTYAAEALGIIGPNAARAAPHLAAAMTEAATMLIADTGAEIDDPDTTPGHLHLRGYGGCPLPFRNICCQWDELLHIAARALGRMGPAAGEATPDLIRMVNLFGTDKWEVIQALGAMGVHGAPAVPVFAEMLASNKMHHREMAAKALAQLGPVAEPAIPALIQAHLDGDGEVIDDNAPECSAPFVRQWTAYALGWIGPAAAPALIELLGHDDADVRAWAADGCRVMGPKAKDAVPALLAALKSNDAEEEENNGMLETNVMNALGSIGPAAAEAAPAFVRLARDGVWYWDQAWLLGRLGPAARDAAPFLLANANEEYEELHSDFGGGGLLDEPLLALIRIGRAEMAEPILRECLTSEGLEKRRFASYVLVRARTAVEPLAPLCRDGLDDPDEVVRFRCALAMAYVNGVTDDTYHRVLEGLSIDDEDDRHAALEHLGAFTYLSEKIDEATRDRLITDIAKLSFDPKYHLNGRSARLLGRMGSKAKAAIPILRQALINERAHRSYIIEGIVSIQQDWYPPH